ncbi:hypothetical protein [Acidomonas methanolica]|uniref:Auto-transporter adhesin head GIN domain-containing protein n=1 Tax=Acidomonas methanolica NBRC 104435 TaxID=1231351 RepID=A0A023D5K7_ACIMT|nr:hypothetical protein [Acidomonas methanolica]MBU2655600.1 hypothetical protein [Acidomonas methanolica]TCS21549.1 hypothetical protein EDC31_13615 [Acidomonas methanolica]GAJ29076.1 hypothetical protein Amme_046_005 [Acidomonas methanolica NBRC 104435]GEL00431.1 hypothetical protein AME01nite_29290 [Acidomonas methanolica NBRC 104435]
MRLPVLSGVALALLAQTPAPADAEEHLPGEELELITPCLGEVQVTVDPAATDGVTLDTSQAGTARVSIRTGKLESERKVVIASKACAPHATLAVTVAPVTALSIHDSKDTRFVLRGPLTSLEASMESGSIDGESAGSADLNLRGTSQAHFALLRRAAQVVAHDSAVLIVDKADLDAFSAQLADTSRLLVSGGRIDALTLVTEGAAMVQIGGTLNTAAITANGIGLVTLPKAIGTVSRNGSGRVQMGPPAPVPSPVQTPASLPEARGATPPAAASTPVSPPVSAPAAPVPAPAPTPTTPRSGGAAVPAAPTDQPSSPATPPVTVATPAPKTATASTQPPAAPPVSVATGSTAGVQANQGVAPTSAAAPTPGHQAAERQGAAAQAAPARSAAPSAAESSGGTAASALPAKTITAATPSQTAGGETQQP